MNKSSSQPTIPSPEHLDELLGGTDIYLLDQVMKGRITREMQVLDAGCGSGRNLTYLLRSGVNVFGTDMLSDAIAQTRTLAAKLAPTIPPDNFSVGDLQSMAYADETFDVVICNAVLHFAPDRKHLLGMLHEMWRVLRSSGMFFSRLASSIGIEDKIELVEGDRYLLPDGTRRLLVDESFLMETTSSLGAELIEPLKTVNVQNQRCMTTWVLRKP